MYDVFLSYAQEDGELAAKIANDLKQAGLEVWFDQFELRPGDLIIDQIGIASRNARNFVAIVSKHSAKSNWFSSELATAIAASDADRRRRIIPILIDRDATLPPFLRQRKFTPMYDVETYRDSLSELIDVLSPRENGDDARESFSAQDDVEPLVHVARELAMERAYQGYALEIEAKSYRMRFQIQALLALVSAFIGVAGGMIAIWPSFWGGVLPIEVAPEFGKYLTFVLGVVFGISFNLVLRSFFENKKGEERGNKL